MIVSTGSSAAAVLVGLLAATVLGSACGGGGGGVGSAGESIDVRRTRAPIAIDGAWDEDDWNQAASVVLTADGTEARPYSDVRFLHDDANLYVAMYAADEDIRSNDGFELAVGHLHVRVSPTGEVSPMIAGLRVAADHDGTLDTPNDDDEEWLVEMAIPLDAVGLRRSPAVAPLDVRRCDTPKNGVVRCGTSRGTLVLGN